MNKMYEDGEDKFAVSGRADQLTDEAQPDKENEPLNIDRDSQSNIAQEEHPESAEPSEMVSRAGRVIKPSSRYKDYVAI